VISGNDYTDSLGPKLLQAAETADFSRVMKDLCFVTPSGYFLSRKSP